MTGFIGGGNMAEALIKGIRGKGRVDTSMRLDSGTLFRRDREEILVSEPREERRKYLEQTYGIKTTLFNIEVGTSCNIIVLAVKPQDMESVCDEIADAVTEDKTVVSIAAGITLSYLQSKLRTKKIVRVMPNTPAIVQEGMSVMSLCECFTDKDIAAVREIFMSVGRVLILPEKYMDTVTALSGSGPAFIACFMEAMIDAGIRTGLKKDNAYEIAIQTLIGTSKLMETGMPLEKVREMVTSPGGTTAAGLKALEETGLKDIVSAAIEAAARRSKELGNGKE